MYVFRDSQSSTLLGEPSSKGRSLSTEFVSDCTLRVLLTRKKDLYIPHLHPTVSGSKIDTPPTDSPTLGTNHHLSGLVTAEGTSS